MVCSFNDSRVLLDFTFTRSNYQNGVFVQTKAHTCAISDCIYVFAFSCKLSYIPTTYTPRFYPFFGLISIRLSTQTGY